MSKRTRLLSELKQKNKEGYSYLLIKEERDMCIEALEKQIAKKPKVIIHDEDVRIGRIKYKKGVEIYKCVCESWITFLQDYCSCCGQKQDWSETNE